ncbi:lipopolysaccharide biosynthesis protein [[Ruminococcus] gnavus]|uniref:lipopolysaccharide biosynthesis protein n=1 Tax=Mediterraneibacter gnavus TaxID=33038 RepID=UPI00210B5090|nr:lipopolysaccharide biosynthesis protein [Mediterraneibacter gnavus]MCQ4701349.1 lipopolysaccharide biosynthesis protein [Mediterraneibacter gnavus]
MNRENIVYNLMWRFAERCGAQIVQLIVSIVLARLLAPTDYGIIAMMNVFISIMDVFVSCGLNGALIQKKDADEVDFSSVFYAQMFFCIVLYIVLFFSAPHISSFYEMPEMKNMIRVLGITLIIAGVKNVQTAFVSRTMQFKKFFFSTLGGTIGAAVIGIGLAYAGFGTWALIGQSLFNNIVDTIILWCTVKWRPKKKFSFERLKGLFNYSWKLLVSSLLETVYSNLRSLVIGKKYSSSDLAYYEKANSWPNLLINNINSSMNSVLFPVMSSVQENPRKVKAMTRRAIKTSTYVIAPMMMGLAACGVPLTRLVLTEKWLPSVPFMVIFCITSMFYPIHTANLNAIKAMGRSDLFLKLEIIKKIVGLVALIITVPISVMAMGYSLLFTSVASQIINSWPNKKLFDYGYLEQIKDILPGILLAIGMGICVWTVTLIGLPDFPTLCIQIPLGCGIYILGSQIFKLDSFEYIMAIVRPIVNKIVQRNK